MDAGLGVAVCADQPSVNSAQVMPRADRNAIATLIAAATGTEEHVMFL